MDILLSNRRLEDLGGSETWVYTMYTALTALGHNVDVFTARPNKLWPHMSRMQNKIYDLGILNHKETMKHHVMSRLKVVIHTSHGIIPEQEKPIPGADYYVSVSEEVREHSLSRGFDSTVIRNPIDVDVFYPKRSTAVELQRILFVSNNGNTNEMMELIKAAAGPHVEVIHLGRNGYSVEHIEHIMNQVDLVVSLGRGCYEAMACGRNVVVLDTCGGDGFVTPEGMLEMRRNNCSGRRYGIQYTPETLALEFAKYDQKLGVHLRNYIIANNEAKSIARQYVELACSQA